MASHPVRGGIGAPMLTASLRPLAEEEAHDYAKSFGGDVAVLLAQRAKSWGPRVEDLLRTPLYLDLACTLARSPRRRKPFATIDAFLQACVSKYLDHVQPSRHEEAQQAPESLGILQRMVLTEISR